MSSAVTRTGAPPQSVRIVIAAEHAIFRHGLRMLLEVETGHRIVGETGDGPTAVALLRALEPDLLLLGTGNANDFSRHILREIGTLGLPVRIILLTGPLDVDDVANASGRAAHSVVRKNAAAGVLFDSIARVMAGQAITSPGPLAAEAAATPNPFGLTARELEILRAIAAGQSNKAIALRCSISENTVKRHLAHIFDKMGASNRVELAMFADHHQLVGVS
jgi:DNA-binding NarL/FixJ family response regulator